MSKAVLFAAVLAWGVTGFSQTASAPQSGIGGKFGPPAVWNASPAFAKAAHSACDKAKNNSANYAACFASQMQTAGASAEAIAFSRALARSGGDAGYMSSFNKVGPVDIAWVTYPLRASSIYGLMLINGSPAIVNAEDLKLLDNKGLQQSLQYQTLQGQFPKVGVWPGDRDGQTWPSSQSGPNGGVQFTLGYPLRNGCRTCAHAGFALFTWNFDSAGKFQGTTFMGLTPPPLNQGSSPSATVH
jgi:hypothetical protein